MIAFEREREREREKVGVVAPILEKMVDSRLRWFVHVRRVV